MICFVFVIEKALGIIREDWSVVITSLLFTNFLDKITIFTLKWIIIDDIFLEMFRCFLNQCYNSVSFQF